LKEVGHGGGTRRAGGDRSAGVGRRHGGSFPSRHDARCRLSWNIARRHVASRGRLSAVLRGGIGPGTGYPCGLGVCGSGNRGNNGGSGLGCLRGCKGRRTLRIRRFTCGRRRQGTVQFQRRDGRRPLGGGRANGWVLEGASPRPGGVPHLCGHRPGARRNAEGILRYRQRLSGCPVGQKGPWRRDTRIAAACASDGGFGT